MHLCLIVPVDLDPVDQLMQFIRRSTDNALL